MSKIQLVESNSEIGAGTRGSSLGIDAMRFAALNSKSSFFKTYPCTTLPNNNHLLSKGLTVADTEYVEALIEVLDNLCNAVQSTLKNGQFPIVLTGDHSNAAGTIAGIRKAYPDKRLGVVWIDAHADLHSVHTSPSGNFHGMPLAISLAEDNEMGNNRNTPSEAETSLWNQLKQVGGISPKLNYEDLVFIGLRDIEFEEEQLLTKNNIKNISVTETRIKGTKETVNESINHLSECDIIHISFDVDSMDPAYVSYGTGTPVLAGFSAIEARQLLCGFMSNEKVCCLEFTEVNPILDDKINRMAETAMELLENATQVIANRLNK